MKSSSAYHDDSIVLEKKYQDIMDWSIWFHEYNIRADITENEKIFSSDPYYLVKYTKNHQFVDVLKGEMNADAIINVLKNRRNLFDIAFFTDKGIEKVYFKDSILTPLYGSAVQSLNISPESKGINQVLIETSTRVEEIRKQANAHGVTKPLLIAGIDLGQDLHTLTLQIEELWLRAQKRELEADLVRFARIFKMNFKSKAKTANMRRAAGLWMWDYAYLEGKKGKKIKKIDAVNAFCKTYPVEDLRLEELDNSNFQYLLDHTDECIKARCVHPYNRRNPDTKQK